MLPHPTPVHPNLRYRAFLVGCRLFYVIDHEHVDGAFGWFELEAQLFLEGGEQRRQVAAGWSAGGKIAPGQFDVEESNEPGAIDDDALDVRHELRDAVGDVVDRASVRLHPAGLDASTTAFRAPHRESVERVRRHARRRPSSEFWTEAAVAAGEDEGIERQFALLVMRDERAPLFEQAPEPQLHGGGDHPARVV